jgi:PTS system cellobiose-specific IIA component
MSTLETAMGLIAGAGDSTSYCMEAIMHAKEGNFSEARACLQKAKEAMIDTHDVQTQLIRGEMTGEKSEVTLLMVHAQNHLTYAMVTRDMATEIIALYEKLATK